MPTTNINAVNLAANTKTANQLSGDINEFVGPAQVTVYAVSSASGIKLAMYADSDISIDDKEIVAIGTTLNKQDHVLDSFEVGEGTRLALFLRETAGVATTDVLLCVEVQPLG